MSCTEKFPDHLLSLIKTSKYVHLATSSTDGIPSVALMNYVYVPASRTFGPDANKGNDYIIFATFANTEKYNNIKTNPNVSLLFHDWVTAKNLSVKKRTLSETSTPEPSSSNLNNPSGITTANPSRLLNLLQELNQSELNEMSATIKGHGLLIAPDTDESKYFKRLLLKSNPDASVFIQGDNVHIVKVKIESAKVTDNENHTKVYN
ncbi:hypothetical protein TBLA_0J00150 [Henningerozyma blattae CBS 6284]|uniref:Pyridoxamine 5'-phosphate oxidase N-terminal domain-containing protein n=1 Tax=Henningerozyma blattae (strain ATCC 34711 / CBS 6284 / DSM 70876 / NBRC 10599 / NRRL Y-10934 / UCD 77-7) TaxID=1071380 RepID=I2H9G4_HENB6|nr:hypothetical protein TBLA_0J00150 [Tetrapisispora blattae CBS 6284]CCH63016.1 hypothetical protein TBLA_0J00150 [Tetrapisispora blattae CBS 6284]